MNKKVMLDRSDGLIQAMFVSRDWQIVKNFDQADLICFTGGADVSPMLYDCPKHPTTQNDLRRDEDCFELFHKALFTKPMVGICRGAQFVNVCNGGEMWQNVDNHALQGTHTAVDVMDGKKYQVTSTHHQMMIPTEEAEVLLVAHETTKREYSDIWETTYMKELPDMEALWYEASRSLCFQPHPEYVDKKHECQELFFLLLEQHIDL